MSSLASKKGERNEGQQKPSLATYKCISDGVSRFRLEIEAPDFMQTRAVINLQNLYSALALTDSLVAIELISVYQWAGITSEHSVCQPKLLGIVHELYISQMSPHAMSIGTVRQELKRFNRTA